MVSVKRILIMSAAILVASVSMASAGSKYMASLVPNTSDDPNNVMFENALIGSKGKILLKDDGLLKAKIKDVKDPVTGLPVTTSQSFKDTGTIDVDGSEYVAVVNLVIPAAGALGYASTVVPMSVKNGTGGTKLDLSTLLGFLDPFTTAVKTLEIQSVEVWGPIGAANVAGCQAVLDTGFNLDLVTPNPCRNGLKVGVAGVNVDG